MTEDLQTIFYIHKHTYEVLKEIWLQCNDEQTLKQITNFMYDELDELWNIKTKMYEQERRINHERTRTF